MKSKFGMGDIVFAKFESGCTLVTGVKCIWFTPLGTFYGVDGFDKSIEEKHLCDTVEGLATVEIIPLYDPPGC